MSTTLHPSSIAALRRAFHHGDAPRAAAHALVLARRGVTQLDTAMADTPLDDDFRDFLYQSVADYFAQAKGYLYVVTNPAQAGFFKVGKTGRAPARRLAELNNEAVVGTFILVKAFPVDDRHWLEQAAHHRLSGFPRHKEFFHGTWEQVCDAVDAAITADEQLLSAAGLLPR
ncbi:GIY-YIG nuclease family protein [Burkholderia cenocepacia]|uniref:GIY-YIG nuclease family protein n=1 Tax=Burkholderia cenocepacia TaxID=95486 RepID=UPI0007621CB5|nr:GIY-YIG nuclease family protein [Burkholderia cenocepacia]KWU19107.1 hypothetical protein AS149_12735 [Burkholderia cenocepacia]